MSSKRIADIKERLSKATDGPWRAITNKERWDDSESGRYEIGTFVKRQISDLPESCKELVSIATNQQIAGSCDGCDTLYGPDAAFIAHAREDIQWLLERLECAERQLGTAWHLVDQAENIINEHAPGHSVFLAKAASFLRGNHE